MNGLDLARGVGFGAPAAFLIATVIGVVLFVSISIVIYVAMRPRNTMPTVMELDLRRRIRKYEAMRRMRAIARNQRRR